MRNPDLEVAEKIANILVGKKLLAQPEIEHFVQQIGTGELSEEDWRFKAIASLKNADGGHK